MLTCSLHYIINRNNINPFASDKFWNELTSLTAVAAFRDFMMSVSVVAEKEEKCLHLVELRQFNDLLRWDPAIVSSFCYKGDFDRNEISSQEVWTTYIFNAFNNDASSWLSERKFPNYLHASLLRARNLRRNPEPTSFSMPEYSFRFSYDVSQWSKLKEFVISDLI